MAEHDNERTLQPLLVEGKQADGNNRHVRDGGIGDEPFEVALDEAHQAAPDEPGDAGDRQFGT